MKINYKEITVTGKNEFIYNGEKWTLSSDAKNVGTSARGIWNYMTNGTVIVRVYKADVLKANKDAAIKLFN